MAMSHIGQRKWFAFPPSENSQFHYMKSMHYNEFTQ